MQQKESPVPIPNLNKWRMNTDISELSSTQLAGQRFTLPIFFLSHIVSFTAKHVYIPASLAYMSQIKERKMIKSSEATVTTLSNGKAEQSGSQCDSHSQSKGEARRNKQKHYLGRYKSNQSGCSVFLGFLNRRRTNNLDHRVIGSLAGYSDLIFPYKFSCLKDRLCQDRL